MKRRGERLAGFKHQVFRAALNALYFSGAHRGAAAADSAASARS